MPSRDHTRIFVFLDTRNTIFGANIVGKITEIAFREKQHHQKVSREETQWFRRSNLRLSKTPSGNEYDTAFTCPCSLGKGKRKQG